MLSQSELERQRYEARRKFHLDEVSFRNWALRQRDEGREEGREENKEFLILQVQQIERQLRRTPDPTEQLKKQTIEQLRELYTQLCAELFPDSP